MTQIRVKCGYIKNCLLYIKSYELPVYDISTLNLDEYINNEELPPNDLLYVLGRESWNIFSSDSTVNQIYPTATKVDIKTLEVKIKFAKEESKEYNPTTNYDSDGEEESLHKTVCLLTQEKLSDFKVLKCIGSGSFGKVFLVKDNNDIYAMKRIRKDLVLK